uniref:Uncharacterized protein n=1 Tax=Arundo donax TaxID=35708 RepID=A0A0A9B415_ARUDO
MACMCYRFRQSF